MKFRLFTICLLLVSFNSNTFSQINWQHTNGPEGGVILTIYDDGEYAFVADENHFSEPAMG